MISLCLSVSPSVCLPHSLIFAFCVCMYNARLMFWSPRQDRVTGNPFRHLSPFILLLISFPFSLYTLSPVPEPFKTNWGL